MVKEKGIGEMLPEDLLSYALSVGQSFVIAICIAAFLVGFAFYTFGGKDDDN